MCGQDTMKISDYAYMAAFDFCKIKSVGGFVSYMLRSVSF